MCLCQKRRGHYGRIEWNARCFFQALVLFSICINLKSQPKLNWAKCKNCRRRHFLVCLLCKQLKQTQSVLFFRPCLDADLMFSVILLCWHYLGMQYANNISMLKRFTLSTYTHGCGPCAQNVAKNVIKYVLLNAIYIFHWHTASPLSSLSRFSRTKFLASKQRHRMIFFFSWLPLISAAISVRFD